MCNNVQRSEEGIGSLGTTVTGIYEIPYECWVLNLGLLQKHSMPLTTEQSPSPSPLCVTLFLVFLVRSSSSF